MKTLTADILARFPQLRAAQADAVLPVEVYEALPGDVLQVCVALTDTAGLRFVSLVSEIVDDALRLLYVFRRRQQPGWLGLRVHISKEANSIATIATRLPAADWHEREVEDLFGVVFQGHPRLGDFVLHDQRWREQLMPMRPDVEVLVEEARPTEPRPWYPRRVLEAAGAFTMPVGPVYSGSAESALFLLETLGEDVIHAFPRLFYKYRAIEKIVEGQSIADALLRVERCSGTSAVAHAWAYVQAVERACGIEVDERTHVLRALFAELERYRHHATAIREICESTAALVATSQASLIEEDLLRLCGELAGHRYLFGAIVPGGCGVVPDRAAVAAAVSRAREIDARLADLEKLLRFSSSFLDRIEEVGIISNAAAAAHGLVGPLARASGSSDDLRSTQPYGPYPKLAFEVPVQNEGDGYARLRVLFAEAHQSVCIVQQLAGHYGAPEHPIPSTPCAGSAIGWSETPRGAAVAYVRLRDDGKVGRFHLTTASFANWHGFYIAAEEFAFQDFPIILATLDLSVAENDR